MSYTYFHLGSVRFFVSVAGSLFKALEISSSVSHGEIKLALLEYINPVGSKFMIK